MNAKKIFGWILKLPLILLILTTAGVGFYAASGALPGFRITYAPPIILTSLIVIYILGAFLTSKGNDNVEQPSQGYLSTSNSEDDEETRRAIEEYQAAN